MLIRKRYVSTNTEYLGQNNKVFLQERMRSFIINTAPGQTSMYHIEEI